MKQTRIEIRRVASAWDDPPGRAFCGVLDVLSFALPPDTVIHSGRNRLHRVTRAGPGLEDIVVKRFPVSQPIKRLVYALRSSKAQRSFDNASRLLQLGIRTPEPLAAVEVWRGGLPVASYYCSRWLDHSALARDLKAPGDPCAWDTIWALGGFVGCLHDLGVVHNDLTAANVLVEKDASAPAGVVFALVDLNRMWFCPVGLRMGVVNLVQLGSFPYPAALLDGYCEQRGLPLRRVRPRYRALLHLRRVKWLLKDRSRSTRRRVGL